MVIEALTLPYRIKQEKAVTPEYPSVGEKTIITRRIYAKCSFR